MSAHQRCMAGLPATQELIGLKIPYGAWEADTLITDTFGNPMFSVLDVEMSAMGAYEVIFGDENGHKLAYVKRRLITAYWKDGWDFCTYKPNFPGQPIYKERDMYGKSVYPFSFLHVRPMKCRYQYSVHRDDMEGMETVLHAMHGWLGSTTVCCTPMVRFGKWQIDFHRPGAGDPELSIDQSKNVVEVERGNDLLAALCIAYAFDKALCQPLVTIIGYQEKEHMDDDDESLDSFDPDNLGAAAQPAGNQMRRGDPKPNKNKAAPQPEQEYYDDPNYVDVEDPQNYDENGNYIEQVYDPNYDENGNYIGADGQYDEEGNYVAPDGYIEENYDEYGNYIGNQYDEEGNYIGPPGAYYDDDAGQYDDQGNYIGAIAQGEEYDANGNYVGSGAEQYDEQGNLVALEGEYDAQPGEEGPLVPNDYYEDEPSDARV